MSNLNSRFRRDTNTRAKNLNNLRLPEDEAPEVPPTIEREPEQPSSTIWVNTDHVSSSMVVDPRDPSATAKSNRRQTKTRLEASAGISEDTFYRQVQLLNSMYMIQNRLQLPLGPTSPSAMTLRPISVTMGRVVVQSQTPLCNSPENVHRGSRGSFASIAALWIHIFKDVIELIDPNVGFSFTNWLHEASQRNNETANFPENHNSIAMFDKSSLRSEESLREFYLRSQKDVSCDAIRVRVLAPHLRNELLNELSQGYLPSLLRPIYGDEEGVLLCAGVWAPHVECFADCSLKSCLPEGALDTLPCVDILKQSGRQGETSLVTKSKSTVSCSGHVGVLRELQQKKKCSSQGIQRDASRISRLTANSNVFQEEPCIASVDPSQQIILVGNAPRSAVHTPTAALGSAQFVARILTPWLPYTVVSFDETDIPVRLVLEQLSRQCPHDLQSARVLKGEIRAMTLRSDDHETLSTLVPKRTYVLKLAE